MCIYLLCVLEFVAILCICNKGFEKYKRILALYFVLIKYSVYTIKRRGQAGEFRRCSARFLSSKGVDGVVVLRMQQEWISGVKNNFG